MGKYEKKRIHDVVLGLTLLLVALVLLVADVTKASNDDGNKTVVVSIDGKKEAEYPLNKDGTHILHFLLPPVLRFLIYIIKPR